MSIEHIVLLEFHDAANETQRQDCLTAIAALYGKIPGILEMKTGKNVSNRAGKITHAAIVTLCDRQALIDYATHPAHLQVLDILKPHLRHISVVDFES